MPSGWWGPAPPIGQNLPVAAVTVARIRAALDVTVRLDPSLQTSTVSFQTPTERREGIGLSPTVSLVNLAAIAALVLIIRLYLAPPRIRPGAPAQRPCPQLRPRSTRATAR